MRVTIHQAEADRITMKIEGKIADANVSTLSKAWQELAASLDGRKLLVDLRGVMHVDGPGHRLLAEIYAKTAAEFLADTPLTKYFAQQACGTFEALQI